MLNTMKIINKIIVTGIFLSMVLVLGLALPGVAQAQYGCSYHSYQMCSGNSLYWYSSCGTQQDLIQYCTNGCYNNVCQNNYNNNYNNNNYNYNYNYNYSSCTYHAYKLCVGNTSIYWYDSCGTQQDLYSTCYSGQVCNTQNQYGQCSAPTYNPVIPPVQPTYIVQYRTACYGNSVYWYDSLGAFSGLNKTCDDGNPCTTDTCSVNKCVYTAIANCPVVNPVQNNCGNGLCETTLGETNATCPSDCKISNTVSKLNVSFFTKKNASDVQWQKTTQVDANSQIYFMVSIMNNSTVQADNVVVSANIPSEISSLGNLKLEGTAISGDIVSGVNIGSLAPANSKSITFEGRTQAIATASTKQATITASIIGQTTTTPPTDSVSINLNPAKAPAVASVSNTPATSGFGAFLKRWYLWILGILVLIFLFVVVFRRFSSDV